MSWSLETVRIGGFDTVTADRTELAEWMAAVCVMANCEVAGE